MTKGKTDRKHVEAGPTPIAAAWPKWLVSPHYRLLYCPIAKAANTSFRTWLLRIEGLWRPEYETTDYLVDATKPLLLGRRRPEEIDDILGTYFQFAFVRNPFTRLASAYVNKFVDRKPVRIQATRTVEQVIRGGWVLRAPLPPRWKRSALRHRTRQGITFREFVTYLARTDSDDLDFHWAPQTGLLARGDLDFVGRFERLDEDLDRLNDALARRPGPRPPPVVLPHRNRSDYAPSGGPFLGDEPAKVLRSMDPRPHLSRFFDPEIEALIVERFREDFERFGYGTTP